MKEFSKATNANSNHVSSKHVNADQVNSDLSAELSRFANRIAGSDGESSDDDPEPIRVITIRLPKSLHLSLKIEATTRQTSMNQLCITKLLLAIEEMDSSTTPELTE